MPTIAPVDRPFLPLSFIVEVDAPFVLLDVGTDVVTEVAIRETAEVVTVRIVDVNGVGVAAVVALAVGVEVGTAAIMDESLARADEMLGVEITGVDIGRRVVAARTEESCALMDESTASAEETAAILRMSGSCGLTHLLLPSMDLVYRSYTDNECLHFQNNDTSTQQRS